MAFSLDLLPLPPLQVLQVLPAHACFVLAGLPLQPSDAGAAAPLPAAGQPQALPQQPPSFVLVGCDLRVSPRAYASAPAILRSEIFAWARSAGEADSPCWVHGSGVSRQRLSLACSCCGFPY